LIISSAHDSSPAALSALAERTRAYVAATSTAASTAATTTTTTTAEH